MGAIGGRIVVGDTTEPLPQSRSGDQGSKEKGEYAMKIVVLVEKNNKAQLEFVTEQSEHIKVALTNAGYAVDEVVVKYDS